MGAGDAQGVAVRLHDGAPALRPLINGDAPGHRAGDGHAGHAADTLQLVGQLVGHQIAQVVYVHSLPGHSSHHHRQHRGIDLQHVGRAHHVVPLALQHGDLLLNVHADGVHIHAVLKLQQHHRHAVLAGGGDLLDLIQRGHRLLHGLGNVRFHRLRACAGVGGHDDDIGKIHIGDQVGRHFQIRHHAQNNDRQHHHKDGQRLLHAEFCHTPAPLPGKSCPSIHYK